MLMPHPKSLFSGIIMVVTTDNLMFIARDSVAVSVGGPVGGSGNLCD